MNTTMKYRLILTFLLCMASFAYAEKAEWKQYGTTNDGDVLSYDAAGLTVEENVVDVWSRFAPPLRDKIEEVRYHVRFDCARRKMKVLQTDTQYTGKPVQVQKHQGKFEPVEPGSKSEVLFTEVCKDVKIDPDSGEKQAEPLQ